ncbi:cellulose synthase [Nocardioides sp. ChNu-153]|uniref:hypothetical protein n=1 Tax=unclassified Nocardioides TaxID=2615069 RepID=UPI002406DDE0|nr:MULTISPECIES: hypothetical protein [unclassified Nocardioides]MDF9717220.1 hypothetical protein [Nocardioides sp. ChNu-99]MDN7122984.1 cellulose synthase [Nocardioides sp. ChNu-153]
MDSTWLALAAVLTALGAAWTVYAWRARGVASAVRGAGLTLLAPAAYLTGTLELAGDVAVEVGDWASGLVFSPVVWTGVALAGAGALLIVLGGVLAARGLGTTPRPRAVPAGDGTRAVPPTQARGAGRGAGRTEPPARGAGRPPAGAAPVDDELADIEALLRRRGIQ